jgi:cell division protein FtsB
MKLNLIALSLLMITSCVNCKKLQPTTVEENSTVSDLKHQIDSLKAEIVELKEQNDNMKDLLRVKDGEVSYWGQKYSSLNDSINKVKSKKQ